MRAVVLVLALAACGGGGKKTEPTTLGNTGGATDGSGNAAESGGDARVIQRTQSGGVIELIGDRPTAMDAANKEMEAHCGPSNYTITQEGEEAIGTDTYAPVPPGGATSTRTDIAWRVHYQCAGAAAPPPP